MAVETVLLKMAAVAVAVHLVAVEDRAAGVDLKAAVADREAVAVHKATVDRRVTVAAAEVAVAVVHVDLRRWIPSNKGVFLPWAEGHLMVAAEEVRQMVEVARPMEEEVAPADKVVD